MKHKLFICGILAASILLGGCADEESSPTPVASPIVSPGNSSHLAGGQDQVIYGKIYPGDEKTYEVLVGNVTRVSFRLRWMLHDLGLSLTTPGGELYSACAGSGGTCGGTFADCTIDKPEQGKWIARISAVDVPSSGKDYVILVSQERYINFHLNVESQKCIPGEPIRITAGPGPLGRPHSNPVTLGGPAPTEPSNSNPVVEYDSVAAEVLTPDNVTEHLLLYDDGQHGDWQADDGRYSNVFTDTAMAGIYGICLTASGIADGVPFRTHDAALAWVSPPPDLSIEASDIVFSNDNPGDGESIWMTATIHNNGGDAPLARIWFYYDERWKGDISIPVVEIPAGGTAEVKAWWVARAGDHEIYVDLHSQCGMEEQDLSNNLAHRPIRVNAHQRD